MGTLESRNWTHKHHIKTNTERKKVGGGRNWETLKKHCEECVWVSTESAPAINSSASSLLHRYSLSPWVSLTLCAYADVRPLTFKPGRVQPKSKVWRLTLSLDQRIHSEFHTADGCQWERGRKHKKKIGGKRSLLTFAHSQWAATSV